jgi:DNA-binding LacI/PurR family transcriptional regulator
MYTEQNGFPAERELVEELGVSRNIVRRALDTLEEQGLIARSPRCRTIVCTPNHSAPAQPVSIINTNRRSASATCRRTLAFSIWPGSDDHGTHAVVQGISNVLDHDAFRLIMGHVRSNSREGYQHERHFLERMLDDNDVAGILIWHRGGENSELFQRVRDAGIPIVFLDRLPPPEFVADFVGVANEDCAMQVVRHLIQLGHRRIGHITNKDEASTVAHRQDGYRRVLETADLPFRQEWVLTATESSSEEVPSVYGSMVEHFFALEEPPTAVFAVNDVIADRFISAVRATGRRVPEDVAVAGFDGLERWANRPPFLTTVYQPFEAMGEKATRLLMDRVSNSENTVRSTGDVAYQHILLDCPLHIHASTSALPSSVLNAVSQQESTYHALHNA